MIHGELADVLAVKSLDARHVRITLRAPLIAGSALPGQFVNVLCGPADFSTRSFDSWDSFLDHRETHEHDRRFGSRLLRRPFAVHRVHSEDDPPTKFDILFKIVGRGTAALAEVVPGATLDLLGPLGKGFNLSPDNEPRTAVLVAGGVGLAPLFLLAQRLRSQNREVYAFIGALDPSQIPIETADSGLPLSFMETTDEMLLTSRDFEILGVKVGISTELGKRGYRGYPTDLLTRYLSSVRSSARHSLRVYACGPWAMLRTTANVCLEHHVDCEVLLEERMGCGLGACMACAVRIRQPDGSVVQKRVCLDGPVFNAREVCWDE